MVDLASSRLVQKRWKAIPRNVAPRKRMVTTVNIMALPLLHEPGDTAERDETGQEKEASGDDRANGQDDLEDRPDDLSLIHISEPTRRTPISYAVFCLKKKKK